jgi:hypothetical protein
MAFKGTLKPHRWSQRFVGASVPLASRSLHQAKQFLRSILLGRQRFSRNGSTMNPLARSNAHSNHSRGAALAHRHGAELPGAGASLKSFIESQDGPVDVKCTRRMEDSSEAAVIAAPATTATAPTVAFRGPVQANHRDAARRAPARTRSLRRSSSSRQGLHTQSLHNRQGVHRQTLHSQSLHSQSLHNVPSFKPQFNEAKAAAKDSIMPARKRISITAKDFADLIAAPESETTPCDNPVTLSYDLPRTVYDSAAMNGLPPSYNRPTTEPRQSQHPTYRTKHDPVENGSSRRLSSSAPPPPAPTLTGNHEQITQRSKSHYPRKQKAASASFRRSSSDVGSPPKAEREREVPNVRRTVSLDEIKVLDVPVLRRRSSVRDGRKVHSDALTENDSGHGRPPRRASYAVYDRRPTYKDAQASIPAGSDRSSQRSESLSSTRDDLATLEFLQSFSEFSELSDEWEPSFVGLAKSLDDPKLLAKNAELWLPRFPSEDLTSLTEQSSGLYSDSSRHHHHQHPPCPPLQPGWNRGGYSPCGTPSSSGSTDPHAVIQRGVTRRISPSLQVSRHGTKSDSRATIKSF